MPCFPMRAMQFVAHEMPGRALVNVTLEPQGVLRVIADGTEAAIDLGGMWWDPDVLSKEQTRGNGRSAIFPQLPQEGIHSERKGLVKDAVLYDQKKKNKCGCWVQKRLVCEKTR